MTFDAPLTASATLPAETLSQPKVRLRLSASCPQCRTGVERWRRAQSGQTQLEMQGPCLLLKRHNVIANVMSKRICFRLMHVKYLFRQPLRGFR